MNEINYIKTSNAPPLVRGKPVPGQKVPGPQLAAHGFLNWGGLLLYFHDSSCNKLELHEMSPSVKLCVPSVASVVKKRINHKGLQRSHREHGVINHLLKTWLSATTASRLGPAGGTALFKVQGIILSEVEEGKEIDE